jgi:hypothetical protein
MRSTLRKEYGRIILWNTVYIVIVVQIKNSEVRIKQHSLFGSSRYIIWVINMQFVVSFLLLCANYFHI